MLIRIDDSMERKYVFIAGDFNIELKQYNKDGLRLILLFESYSLQKTIHANTRRMDCSTSCIDYRQYFHQLYASHKTHIPTRYLYYRSHESKYNFFSRGQERM